MTLRLADDDLAKIYAHGEQAYVEECCGMLIGEAPESGGDVGYYHSHPDHPARPSDFDREHAWPGTSYMIISVIKGRVVDGRSWRLTDDRSRFEEEELLGSNGARVAFESSSVE